ncbi:nucleic-acid-binding protein from transposon X-element [Trichonephila clavata]|uniref:Nucleic-acid-binding protein from transposon X-element n=1 Tax=Trichonephila clavata TaxID=2740835 RepID=A0A8X6LUV2_TRICU|nr:nucleic-acid-binding protein from transposon X-element [Trichonephila clavata]
MKIFPQTPYAYHIIRRYINDNNLEGHTFSLPEDKKLRAVIRGLPTDTDPSEIIAELKAHNICVEECHNMTNRKTGAPMPLFIIICTKSINNRGLFKIKELNNMKIVVEILRKKYGPPQCFRCQGFFHSSKYCTRAPRCVKCAGDHLTKACTKDIKDPAKCCLCEGDHPASYLQCPKNPNNMPKKEKKNNIKQVDGTVFASPPPPASNAWDSRSTTPANNNNQKPTLIPRQIALAQAKAHNQAVQPVPISPHRSHPSSQPHLYQTFLTYSISLETLKSSIFSTASKPSSILPKLIKPDRLACLPSTIIFTMIAFNRSRQNHTSLRITSWNSQALKSRVQELEEFINDWNPDIILVQETQLRPCDLVTIPNFTLYRTDRLTHRGGTAIFIKRSIAHTHFIISNPNIENTAITLHRTNEKSITIISAYRPPRSKICEQDLQKFFRNRDCCLVIGDLNAKNKYWNPHPRVNQAGTVIYNYCNKMGISIHAPTEPTRFDAHGVNNTLDIALAKGLHTIAATSISELTSDHNPVNFDISLNNFNSPSISTCSFPNWTKFQTVLTESIPGNPVIANEDDIEKSISNLNNKIQEAIHATSTYKAIHHPTFSSLWMSNLGKHSERENLQIQRIQNMTIRGIAGIPRYIPVSVLHEELKIEPIATFISKLHQNFHSTIATHNNPTINSQDQFKYHPRPPTAFQ